MTPKIFAILKFPLLAIQYPSLLLKRLLAFTLDAEATRDYHKLAPNGDIPFINILDICPTIDQSIEKVTFLEGASRVMDFAFLMHLAQQFDGCEYLEIGSWRGESLINISKHCKTVTSLSLSADEMQAYGFSKEAAEADGFFVKNISNLTRVLHNSQTFDFNKLDKKFDLIFVDGDHKRHAVKKDTENVFKLLKDENSIIVWHDAGINYNDNRHEVLSAVLEGAPVDKRANIYRVSNTLCAIYSTKTYKPMTGNMYLPKQVFDVSINSTKL